MPRTGPLVITEGPPERPWIAFCNEAARAAGIVPAMKLAAAHALAHSLAAVPRRQDHEREALQELACWAYQFSAHVAVYNGASAGGLVLETGGSERLFDGRGRLHRRIRHALADLGYRAQCAYAPTPRAAWLLGTARAMGLAAGDVPADTPSLSWPLSIRRALAGLPIGVLEWDADTTQLLGTLGLTTIGQVLGLPRDAFARRFGVDRLDQLDRALGLQPDPQPPFTPPLRFFARIELPADVAESGQLMFPAHRLLCSLEGFLRGHHAGATELLFTAHPNPHGARPAPPTRIVLTLAAAQHDAQRLAKLLAERLTRVTLPGPAVELSLAVERLVPWQNVHASLLPFLQDETGHAPDRLQLIETLHARLGSERVFQVQPVEDHRPERAMRIVPPAAPGDRPPAAMAPPAWQRPLLILPAPQPLSCADRRRSDGRGQARPHRQDESAQDAPPRYGGPLALVAGPERIEAGWWDHGDPQRAAVHRDYFVARNPRGQLLWIYRELQQPRRWFLHGFFS